MKDSNDFEKSDQNKAISYTFTVGENLFRKIEKIIDSIKLLDHNSLSKQRWFIEAFIEKLSKENETLADNLSNIPKARQLAVRIDDPLNKKIEQRIELIRKFRNSYSKKQWVLEAIYEKLDRDEERARKLMSEVSGSNEN